MKKVSRFLSLALALVMLSSLVGCGLFKDTTVYAVVESGKESEGFIYDVYENRTVTVTGTTLVDDYLIIPDTLDVTRPTALPAAV